MLSIHRSLLSVIVLSMLGGCAASYVTPGPKADMGSLGASEEMKRAHGDSTITAEFDKKPLASFPAAIAAIHVQGAGYQSYTYRQPNDAAPSKYTVITRHEAETDGEFDRLKKLPMVAGIAPMNEMLFGGPVNSDMDLRQAAARVQADIVLLYTFDTRFHVKDFIAPLSVISLGFSPNQQASVSTTASAILMDTRSGYIYSVAEASAESTQLANAWTSDDAVDDTRRRTEAQSFDKLVGEVEKTWPDVVKQYAKPAAKAGT